MANLALLDLSTFSIDYPSTLIASLRSGHSTCTRFSPCGSFLASGRVDGGVVVFDCDVLGAPGVGRRMSGPRGQVGSVSWSGDSRYLIATAQDWAVWVWDLSKRTGESGWCRSVEIGKMAYAGELSLVDSNLAVVTAFESPPFLLDLAPGATRQYALSSAPKRADTEEVTEKMAAADAKQQTTTATFTNDGRYVLSGTSKGFLNIISVESKKTLYSTKICSGVILSIRVSSSGRSIVLNCSDRVIRSLSLPDLSTVETDKIHLEVEHKFSDVVNRLSWNHVSLSSDSSYIVASTYNNHDIYIWETTHGSLVKILEAPAGAAISKEEMGSVEWHPAKAVIAATGLESGRIGIWGTMEGQRWSRLAPDFEEVEENVEYVEEEDEFDEVDESIKRQAMLDAEGEDVDVLDGGASALLGLKDSNGEVVKGREGWSMPILLDLGEESEDEFVMVGTGTMRRKSPGPAERPEKLGRESAREETVEGSGTETDGVGGMTKAEMREAERLERNRKKAPNRKRKGQ